MKQSSMALLGQNRNLLFQIIFLFFCWVSLGFSSPKFLTISDIHYGSQNTGKQGQDTGKALLKMALNQFKLLSNQMDFILVLGDLPTHSLRLDPKKGQYESAVFRGLYEANHDLKPMFYISGNNDPLSGNYQPFEWKGRSPLTYAKNWTGACAHCEDLLIDALPMQSKGYYSSYVMPNNKDILLIVLNTTQWAKPEWLQRVLFPYPNQDNDAAEQFLWFEQQLKMHRAKQLLIAMHIPPGYSYSGKMMWQQVYLQQFIHLLEQHYAAYDQITLLTAHTHMDEIRKIHLKHGLNLYAYATPSISRDHNNNSGMKVFTLNKKMAVENYTTYYTSQSNSWGEEQYQAKAIFSQCKLISLSQCLDNISDKQVCNALEQGLFYGVKSSKIPKNICRITYRVEKLSRLP